MYICRLYSVEQIPAKNELILLGTGREGTSGWEGSINRGWGEEWREGVKEEGVEEGSNRNEELVGEGRGEGEEEEGRRRGGEGEGGFLERWDNGV